jgi:hypothetical protein
MREPKRLLSEGATDFERQLLSAVANERPSTRLRSRMQRGLGLVGPVLWAGNVKAMFSTLTTKSGALAGTLGVVAAGALVVAISSSSGHARLERAQDEPVQHAPAAAAEVVLEQPRPEPPTALPLQSPEAEAQAQNTPSASDMPAPASERVGAMSSALREEIAVLDGARAALQHGAPKQARAALRLYARRFPEGMLRREAALLRRQAAQRATSPVVDAQGDALSLPR